MAVRKQIFIAMICEYFVRTLDYRRLMGDPAFPLAPLSRNKRMFYKYAAEGEGAFPTDGPTAFYCEVL